jgi:hypothetical protein
VIEARDRILIRGSEPMKIRGNSFKAVLGSLAVPMMFFALSGQAGAQEAPGHIQIDSSAELQIDQSGNTEPSDSFELQATFTNNDLNAESSCDGDDPVAQGLTITLGTGSCGSSTGVVTVVIPPFSSTDDARFGAASKKHGGHKKHKNHFKLKMPVTASNPSSGQTENASLDASITVLPTPAGTCGQWSIDAEVSNVDLSALTANPVVVSIGQGDDSGCNDQIQAQFDNNDDQGDNDQGDNGDGGDGNSQGD